MILIDGKSLAQNILDSIKEDIKKSKLTLAVILATDDVSSHMYVKMKSKKAEEVGIKTEIFTFEKDCTQDVIINKIKELNKNSQINGILVQLPLFNHLENFKFQILNSITVSKDVDCLTTQLQGLSSQLAPNSILPATVEAILECINSTTSEDLSWSNILNRNIDLNKNYLTGKEIVIINNTDLIGKPLAMLLSNLNATVTILNKYTKDISEFTKKADILVTATGQTNIIDHTMVKEGATVIDVTSVKKGESILGDVTVYKDLTDKVKHLTPVPGGVGPLTIACLLRNVYRLSKLSK